MKSLGYIGAFLGGAIAGAEIHNEILGSDHCPVELVLSDK